MIVVQLLFHKYLVRAIVVRLEVGRVQMSVESSGSVETSSSAVPSGSIIRQKPGQMIGGHGVGIIVLNVGYPLIPGNVANSTTYPFPVRFKVVEGADIPSLLAGDRSLLAPSLRAAEELVADGCRAIVGACGYFAKFQREMAEALPVPVFMSSLCQVPIILGSLRPSERLGIVCASKPSLDAATLAAAGVPAAAPLVVYGMERSDEFRTAILEGKGWMDNAAIEAEVVDVAVQLSRENPDVRALLLECSDLPPYAKSVQDATGLPVWDFITLIDWIYEGVVRRQFKGFV
ncbi:MAG TPA: aspartate/glutamate racemase family protein [Candidatus Limnocylindrales bacterium]